MVKGKEKFIIFSFIIIDFSCHSLIFVLIFHSFCLSTTQQRISQSWGKRVLSLCLLPFRLRYSAVPLMEDSSVFGARDMQTHACTHNTNTETVEEKQRKIVGIRLLCCRCHCWLGSRMSGLWYSGWKKGSLNKHDVYIVMILLFLRAFSPFFLCLSLWNWIFLGR